MRLGAFFGLIATVVCASLAHASSTAVAVYGPDQAFFQSVPGHEVVAERAEAMWKFISGLLSVPQAKAPELYIYPFDPAIEPALLESLQLKIFSESPQLKGHPEMIKQAFAPIYGITYPADLFPPDAPDRGRVVQINFSQAFGDTFDGYGLYISSHEMTHVALNALGVPVEAQHCLMARENADGQSLMLKIAKYELSRQWSDDRLVEQGPLAKGYAEESGHCAMDTAEMQQMEGPQAVQRMLAEVEEWYHKLAADL